MGTGWLQLNGNQMGGTEKGSVFSIPISSQNLCLSYISFVTGGGKELLLGKSSPHHKIKMY